MPEYADTFRYTSRTADFIRFIKKICTRRKEYKIIRDSVLVPIKNVSFSVPP